MEKIDFFLMPNRSVNNSFCKVFTFFLKRCTRFKWLKTQIFF